MEVSEDYKDDNSTILPADATQDGKEVQVGTVKMAVYQLGIFLELRGFGEKVFTDIRLVRVGLHYVTTKPCDVRHIDRLITFEFFDNG